MLQITADAELRRLAPLPPWTELRTSLKHLQSSRAFHGFAITQA